MKAAGRRKTEVPELKLEHFAATKAYGTLWFGDCIVAVICPNGLVGIARDANLEPAKLEALTDAVLAFYGQSNEVARG